MAYEESVISEQEILPSSTTTLDKASLRMPDERGIYQNNAMDSCHTSANKEHYRGSVV